MKEVIYMIIFLMFLGCKNIQQEGTNNIPNSALHFLKSKKYIFSIKKTEIPITVIDSISSFNNEKFKIGDSSDVGKISFSDASMAEYEYKRKLQFVLVNDTFCLIAYTEGGIGTHDVIDYMQYKGIFNHTRYVTTDILNDTVKLENYLARSPKALKIK